MSTSICTTLYAAHQQQGAIVGRTFTGCRLQGPAIVLIGGGTTFDETNFGDPRGGMKNLLLQPMGDKALGTVPMHGCTFVGCEFYNVGFTGPRTSWISWRPSRPWQDRRHEIYPLLAEGPP